VSATVRFEMEPDKQALGPAPKRERRAGVERLHERLKGEAELTTMEGWLTLRRSGDGRGHIETRGRMCDDLARGNTLEFQVSMGPRFS
jgi:hypothetical protein